METTLNNVLHILSNHNWVGYDLKDLSSYTPVKLNNKQEVFRRLLGVIPITDSIITYDESVVADNVKFALYVLSLYPELDKTQLDVRRTVFPLPDIVKVNDWATECVRKMLADASIIHRLNSLGILDLFYRITDNKEKVALAIFTILQAEDNERI